MPKPEPAPGTSEHALMFGVPGPVIVDAGPPLLTPEQQAAITAIIEHARASAGLASPGSLYGKAFVLAASFGHGETYRERDEPDGFEWLKIRWHRAKPASAAVSITRPGP